MTLLHPTIRLRFNFYRSLQTTRNSERCVVDKSEMTGLSPISGQLGRILEKDSSISTHIYNDTVFLITFMNGDVCECRCLSLFVQCHACVHSTVSNGRGVTDYDRFADVSTFWLIDDDVILLLYFLDSTVFGASFIPSQGRQRSSRSSTRQLYVRLLRIKRS